MAGKVSADHVHGGPLDSRLESYLESARTAARAVAVMNYDYRYSTVTRII